EWGQKRRKREGEKPGRRKEEVGKRKPGKESLERAEKTNARNLSHGHLLTLLFILRERKEFILKSGSRLFKDVFILQQDCEECLSDFL
ncbi:MAG: hypothetical protein IIZ39_01175, partial [Blautia sp.]|nr:hypothetical protein [Blautia sp.]